MGALPVGAEWHCYRPQGKVMFSQASVICPQSASWQLGHCSSLLQRGRYVSYWNAFLFVNCFHLNSVIHKHTANESMFLRRKIPLKNFVEFYA